MSGLILKLAPRERLLVNCALIENGDRRARLRILTKGTNILRIKDATNPMAAQTDLEKCFCISQLLVIDSTDRDALREELLQRLADLQEAAKEADSLLISNARNALKAGQDYQCMKGLRVLLDRQSTAS